MGYTIGKLNEAEFFLNKLKEHENIFPEFDYYLNAFVSSARSVLWIMKSEYNSNNGWKNWYENKSTNQSEDNLLKGITGMRNRSLKQEPLKTEKYFMMSLQLETVDVWEEVKKFVEEHGKDKKYDITIKSDGMPKNRGILKDKNSLTIQGRLDVYDTVEEFKDNNIIDKCEEYFLWLKSIVKECSSLFND
ncbi:hypothetical protein [Tissierella praeacuta]|uniref:hypothetical protein n=1 Tax=Tissierella praeacuta TaxID=43131 RepID=UPI0028AA7BD5|nr:hypothetical protein [Tissierella praeacuta]